MAPGDTARALGDSPARLCARLRETRAATALLTVSWCHASRDRPRRAQTKRRARAHRNEARIRVGGRGAVGAVPGVGMSSNLLRPEQDARWREGPCARFLLPPCLSRTPRLVWGACPRLPRAGPELPSLGLWLAWRVAGGAAPPRSDEPAAPREEPRPDHSRASKSPLGPFSRKDQTRARTRNPAEAPEASHPLPSPPRAHVLPPGRQNSPPRTSH